MLDAVDIGQDTRTSFASSLPGGFHDPTKKTVETMQVLKRGVKVNGKTVYKLETVFVPPSLIDQYGCTRKGSMAVCKGLLGMHSLSGSDTVSNPNGRGKVPTLPCKYSLKRTSTNLIQFCGRTVLLAETCSQLALLLSVSQLSKRKHIVECYQA